MSNNPYSTRQYDVRLLLAAPDSPLLWEYPLWQKLVPELTPLLSSDRGRTSLRMTQLDLRKNGSPNETYIRFGPIGWNEKAHRKWTHGSPDTAESSMHWGFCGFSAWAPAPSKCNDCPSDGYLVVRNEATPESNGKSYRFSYSVLAAIACDLPEADSTMERAFHALRSTIPSVLLAKTQRSWAGVEVRGSGSLTDCEAFGAPFKPGRQPVSLNMLTGDWHSCA